eukprot:483104-Rhodomonas_salina.2
MCVLSVARRVPHELIQCSVVLVVTHSRNNSKLRFGWITTVSLHKSRHSMIRHRMADNHEDVQNGMMAETNSGGAEDGYVTPGEEDGDVTRREPPSIKRKYAEYKQRLKLAKWERDRVRRLGNGV